MLLLPTSERPSTKPPSNLPNYLTQAFKGIPLFKHPLFIYIGNFDQHWGL